MKIQATDGFLIALIGIAFLGGMITDLIHHKRNAPKDIVGTYWSAGDAQTDSQGRVTNWPAHAVITRDGKFIEVNK